MPYDCAPVSRPLLLSAAAYGVRGLAFVFGDLGLARTSASTGSLLLAVKPLLSVRAVCWFCRLWWSPRCS